MEGILNFYYVGSKPRKLIRRTNFSNPSLYFVYLSTESQITSSPYLIHKKLPTLLTSWNARLPNTQNKLNNPSWDSIINLIRNLIACIRLKANSCRKRSRNLICNWIVRGESRKIRSTERWWTANWDWDFLRISIT